MTDLIAFIRKHDGINDKAQLTRLVVDEFECVRDRSVYYTRNFAIRFCKADSANMGNTVLSLSALQKYDQMPFVVCICAPRKNYLLLANTSFLLKISHSSQTLSVDNIRGSFNGSDIIRQIDGLQNIPENFEVLFAIHQNSTFEESLIRLVEATNNIVPTGKRYDVSVDNRRANILDAPKRAEAFAASPKYRDLLIDLDTRVRNYENEILVAALIEDVKTRGNIIEYLISGDSTEMRLQIVDALVHKKELPRPYLQDGLGDFTKVYPDFHTETDIKTKIMVLMSAPKGYNLDKMLEFLAEENAVFMLYFVGIDYERRSITTKLVSMFQETLVDNTVVQAHWAGRNSRGVTQFNGEAIKKIILEEDNTINRRKAEAFLERILLL